MEAFNQATLREKLARRRDELEALLARVRSNIKRGLDPDSRERAKELEDSDVVDTLGNEAIDELTLIQYTLKRLESGEYGTCEGCGDPIASNRLDAYPYASRCIDCAEDEERLLQRA